MSKKLIQAAAGAGGESVYVEDVFSTYLYTGDSSTDRDINNGIDLDGEGGLIWGRARDNTDGHVLIDTERGAGKILRTHLANAEYTDSGSIDSFNADGYHIAGNSSNINNSSYDYVSWTFRRQAGFFDVVTWTGDGSAGRDISHNLGSTPGCIAVKRLSGSDNWQVYHRSLSNPDTKILAFNLTNGEMNQSTPANLHSATATKFSVGSDTSVNYSGQTYVAYLFAHDDQSFGDDSDEAIIKCGSYSGNGLTTGNEITLGFEPQWLMVKRTDSTGYWAMMDIMRGITDSTNNYLQADSSAAEQATGSAVTPTATGFNILTDTSPLNNSSGTYIYIAIRRPMKTPEAGTDVFYYATQDASSPGHEAPVGNWPVDWAIKTKTSGVDNRSVVTRLLGAGYLVANTTDIFSSNSDYSLDYQNGFFESTSAYSDRFAWMFKRGAKCFDVVAYTGTGSNRTINHNLGVAPEMMIIKARESLSPYVAGWVVYHKAISPSDSIYLSQNGGSSGASFQFASTAPTDSVFTLGSAVDVNMSGKDFISYHFATLAGVSKVGSYTGTGSDLNVDCGFSSGARFILIKRTDSSGDWYVYDSSRGIVTGNDPFMLLNSTAAETTGTDYIDPLSSGFTVTSSAPAALNNSGGSYIFLAIA